MSIELTQELHKNFIDFSYEANSQRAFPSALDGLKPGQRACLWEFYIKGYSSSKPHVKSAKVSGGVIGSWWPHGDTAVYETFARMSQPWINNIPEIDWHGANGSQIGGPECASARYTEARLSKASEKGFFTNIKKDTVNMIPNFSEDEEWPELLPAIFPRLFVNGSQGIGVTIANVWAPGNLGEFVAKVEEYLKTGEVDCSNIYPDFPTGGIIINKNDLKQIYETGKGRIVLRAKTTIENNSILIHELPYQVYAEPLIDSIKELVIKEEIKGIKDIYNKSDKKHILIEIECENSPLSVLNNLYASTDLQKVISPNQYALVSKVPQLLTLKQYIEVYVKHNLDCLKREYNFDLNKAKSKLEIAEGLIKALANIDDIIQLIKSSENVEKAKSNLCSTYGFTANQAKAIVDMRLAKLTKLDGVELEKEKADLEDTVKNCIQFLNSPELQQSEFLTRLNAFNKEFGYPRRTEITQINVDKKEKETELIEPEKCVVIMTEAGNIKRVPVASFKTQKRNTKGIKTQDDITTSVIRTNTVDSLMVFTNLGKMYRLIVNDIPVGTNSSKGVSIKSLIEMETYEKPTIIYSIYKDTEAKYIMFVTKNGMVKKTALDEYVQTKRKNGVIAINIRDNDELAAAFLVKDEDIILLTEKGYGIKFNSKEIGATARSTIGVKGINLIEEDAVSAALPVHDNTDELAIFLGSGFGKKIKLSELIPQKRGGRGLLCYKLEERDYIAAAALVSTEDNVLIIGNNSSICISAQEIPSLNRVALGNIMIKNNRIISVSKV